MTNETSDKTELEPCEGAWECRSKPVAFVSYDWQGGEGCFCVKHLVEFFERKVNALESRARENEEKAKLATECADLIRYHADCEPDDTGWCSILEESRDWLSRYDQTKREE